MRERPGADSGVAAGIFQIATKRTFTQIVTLLAQRESPPIPMPTPRFPIPDTPFWIEISDDRGAEPITLLGAGVAVDTSRFHLVSLPGAMRYAQIQIEAIIPKHQSRPQRVSRNIIRQRMTIGRGSARNARSHILYRRYRTATPSEIRREKSTRHLGDSFRAVSTANTLNEAMRIVVIPDPLSPQLQIPAAEHALRQRPTLLVLIPRCRRTRRAIPIVRLDDARSSRLVMLWLPLHGAHGAAKPKIPAVVVWFYARITPHVDGAKEAGKLIGEG